MHEELDKLVVLGVVRGPFGVVIGLTQAGDDKAFDKDDKDVDDGEQENVREPCGGGLGAGDGGDPDGGEEGVEESDEGDDEAETGVVGAEMGGTGTGGRSGGR